MSWSPTRKMKRLNQSYKRDTLKTASFRTVMCRARNRCSKVARQTICKWLKTWGDWMPTRPKKKVIRTPSGLTRRSSLGRTQPSCSGSQSTTTGKLRSTMGVIPRVRRSQTSWWAASPREWLPREAQKSMTFKSPPPHKDTVKTSSSKRAKCSSKSILHSHSIFRCDDIGN